MEEERVGKYDGNKSYKENGSKFKHRVDPHFVNVNGAGITLLGLFRCFRIVLTIED